MDFLKKNGFAVGLSALGLLAVTLLYLMVIQKIWGGLADARGDLDKVKTEYERNGKKNPPPSAKSKDLVESRQKEWNGALAEGTSYYEQKKTQFEMLPDEFSSTPDDVTGFKTFYETRLKKLREEYLALFKAKETAASPAPATPVAPGEVPEEGKEAAPAPAAPAPAVAAPAAPAVAPAAAPAAPTAPEITALSKLTTPEDVKRAGKELWIISEVYRVLTERKIDGLLSIGFPEREKGSIPEPGSKHNWIKARVIIEMPFTEVEPFLARLFQSDRVPFRLDTMTTQRKDELVIVKMFQDEKKKIEEPPVVVTFDLSALNWIDVPPAPAGAEKDTKK